MRLVLGAHLKTNYHSSAALVAHLCFCVCWVVEGARLRWPECTADLRAVARPCVLMWLSHADARYNSVVLWPVSLQHPKLERATARQFCACRQREKRKAELTSLLNRVLLRRTKEGTIRDQLPRKSDNIVFCPLAPMQKRAYRHCLVSRVSSCLLCALHALLVRSAV